MIKILVLLTFLILSNTAMAFNVGDTINYDVFIGDELQVNVTRTIKEIDENAYGSKHILMSVTRVFKHSTEETEQWAAAEELEREGVTEAQCNADGGETVEVKVGSQILNGCRLARSDEQYVIYSDHVPFQIVESKGSKIGSNPVIMRLRSFAFGQ